METEWKADRYSRLGILSFGRPGYHKQPGKRANVSVANLNPAGAGRKLDFGEWTAWRVRHSIVYRE